MVPTGHIILQMARPNNIDTTNTTTKIANAIIEEATDEVTAIATYWLLTPISANPPEINPSRGLKTPAQILQKALNGSKTDGKIINPSNAPKIAVNKNKSRIEVYGES